MMFDPIFTGQHCRLASPMADDAETFALWTQDDNYMRMLDDDPVRPEAPINYASFGDASDKNSYYFHLRTLSEDILIGFVVLFNFKWGNQSAEMAIGIGDTSYRGKGYGQDALKLILNYGFNELNLHRISLTVMDYNTPAIKAYERAGFVLEGKHRQAVQRQGKRYDLLLYGMLQDEFLAM
jgi:RimJ/RimL family protein N-acetyltransferase